MKTEDLKAVLEDGKLSTEEKMSKIQAMNGVDINAEKDKQASEITKLKEQVSTLTTKNQELTTDASKYKDYEELKKFKTDTLAREEESRKTEFLKAQGCKHPELFVERFDFSKAKYNEEKKTYEGLDEDIKGAREKYKDMFTVKPGVQVINPSGGGNSNDQLSGVEKAFYEANPHLMPKN